MARILIVSHTPHYKKGNNFVGWEPTIREISQLAQLFDEVVHVAPLHSESPTPNAMPYDSDRVQLVPVPPAGGATLREKLDILRFIPLYIRLILRELQDVDVVHVRCPSNISLIAIILLAFIRKPRRRWIKYAGNWNPSSREARSYTFQRWWLKLGFARAQVTVNGEWPGQPLHVHAFLNPCLTDEELDAAAKVASDKRFSSPIRLIFVGRLEDAKGVSRALREVERLRDNGIAFRLDLVGDGPDRSLYEDYAAQTGIRESVIFHGWQARSDIAPLYDSAHFLLFPSSSEGWPKVISEAMAAGVVPLAGDVSSIRQYLECFGCGRAIAAEDVDGFTKTILWYIDNPHEWMKEARNGVSAANLFSYPHYLNAVRGLLSLG